MKNEIDANTAPSLHDSRQVTATSDLTFELWLEVAENLRNLPDLANFMEASTATRDIGIRALGKSTTSAKALASDLGRAILGDGIPSVRDMDLFNTETPARAYAGAATHLMKLWSPEEKSDFITKIIEIEDPRACMQAALEITDQLHEASAEDRSRLFRRAMAVAGDVQNNENARKAAAIFINAFFAAPHFEKSEQRKTYDELATPQSGVDALTTDVKSRRNAPPWHRSLKPHYRLLGPRIGARVDLRERLGRLLKEPRNIVTVCRLGIMAKTVAGTAAPRMALMEARRDRSREGGGRD